MRQRSLHFPHQTVTSSTAAANDCEYQGLGRVDARIGYGA